MVTAAQKVKQLSEDPNLPAVLLILCPDLIRRERIIKAIIANRKTEIVKIAPENLSPSALSSALSAQSLFSPATLALVGRIESIKADVLNSVAKDLPALRSKGTVIFSGASLPDRSAFLKAIRSIGETVEVPELSGAELRRWVEKELKVNGVTSSEPQAIELLIQLGDESPDTLHPLLEHVALSLDESTLTRKHLLSLFSLSASANEYEFVELLSKKNALAKTTAEISTLLQNGKNAFLLLGLLAKTFSQYAAIKSDQQKGSTPYETRAALGVPPWLFTKLANGAAPHTLPALQSTLRALLNTDSLLKNRSLGAELVLTSFVSHVQRTINNR